MTQIKAEYVDHMGNDNSIVNAARVSFAKEASNYTDADNNKLIAYLAKHNHWSPFTHTCITLRCKAPIAIHAQVVKHTVGFNVNTVSRRYVSDAPEIFIPTFRTKPDGSIKQGSGDEHADNEALQKIYQEHCQKSVELYTNMIKQDVAPEQARFVLPQGAMTEWVWTGNVASFARFYNQRTDFHSQVEIRVLALQVGKIIEELYPVSWQAMTQ